MKKFPNNLKAKLIYNPHAGKKRKMLPLQTKITLEDIKDVLDQYQIPTDYYPTKSAGHAVKLAQAAKKEGYKMVIVAGGDGTVGEVIKGLINTEITLAILPLGSFMNVARMLNIPFDLEKAASLIKIGRERKIDVASITKLDGERLEEPNYFLEQAGIGLEADAHYYLTGVFERKEYFQGLGNLIKGFFRAYDNPVKIYLDDEKQEIKARLIMVSNGPLGGAALNLAPESRLNDHRLTVSLFKMRNFEIILFYLRLILTRKITSKKIEILKAEKVRVITKNPRPIHADARVFGTTPVEFKILPGALNVIVGFPKKTSPLTLNKRTNLDL